MYMYVFFLTTIIKTKLEKDQSEAVPEAEEIFHSAATRTAAPDPPWLPSVHRATAHTGTSSSITPLTGAASRLSAVQVSGGSRTRIYIYTPLLNQAVTHLVKPAET